MTGQSPDDRSARATDESAAPSPAALDRRLSAIERSLSADDDAGPIDDRPDAASVERVETLAERVDDLEAATQAVRGYVGNVRSVNREVEQRADAALAAVDRLQERMDATDGGSPGDGGSDARSPSETSTPRDSTAGTSSGDTDVEHEDEVSTNDGTPEGGAAEPELARNGPTQEACPTCGAPSNADRSAEGSGPVGEPAAESSTRSQPRSQPRSQSRPNPRAQPQSNDASERANSRTRSSNPGYSEERSAVSPAPDGGALTGPSEGRSADSVPRDATNLDDATADRRADRSPLQEEGSRAFEGGHASRQTPAGADGSADETGDRGDGTVDGGQSNGQDGPREDRTPRSREEKSSGPGGGILERIRALL